MSNHSKHVIVCTAAFIMRDLHPVDQQDSAAQKHCEILADLTQEQWESVKFYGRSCSRNGFDEGKMEFENQKDYNY